MKEPILESRIQTENDWSVPDPKPVDFSIVVPVYCNAESLMETYQDLKNIVFNGCKHCGEIIFVDDGSTDNSFEILQKIWESDKKRVKVIKLSRNYGQISAIYAGYKYSKGKCIINISADLQDPPQMILKMLDHFLINEFEIVIAHRISRDESFARRIASRIFYGIMKKLIFKNMPLGGFDFVLISENVKNIILNEYDANPFWQGQILWTGYPVKFLPYHRRRRNAGTSKWTFSKKIKYLIDGIMSYSYFPLRLMVVIGLLTAMASFTYGIFIIIGKICGWITIYGWAPLMMAVLFFSGIQMLMLGVIGEYVWRTLDQTRNRKPFLIEEIIKL